MVYLFGFHTYINEMHGSRSKIPSKKSRQAALRGGIYSGGKGLIIIFPIRFFMNPPSILLCLPRRSTDGISHTDITLFTMKFIRSTRSPSHRTTSQNFLSKLFHALLNQ
jgi:hypothetical protein